MTEQRGSTKKIKIGSIYIGGDSPIRVQSMAKTDTRDVEKTVRQIKRLEKSGCEIVRVAVPDMESARVLRRIKKKIGIPLVADIHFNYMLAIESIKHGVDKIRINPGNIGDRPRVLAVVAEAKKAKIPIRIGINSGSLRFEKDKDRASQMAKTALDYIELFGQHEFNDIVVSLKASDVKTTLDAYRAFSKKSSYPLHIGITEAGMDVDGIVKSSIGIGTLLEEGIGNTIRVSLTGDPEREVFVGYQILQSLKLRSYKPEIISCPTCGRCKINIEKICEELNIWVIKNRQKFSKEKILRIAVMGCVVNGPGEARDADIGLAGTRGEGVLFRKGEVIKRVKEKDWLKVLKNEITKEFKK